MSLLATDAYRFALGKMLSEANESISLVSAFVTSPGIDWVLERLPARTVNMRVIARWRCADLASKASDIEVYPLLRSRGARFYVHPDLHAKLVLVDNLRLLVGSANLTRTGLQLVPGGNREIGTALQATQEDLTVIDNLFHEGIEIGPNLYEAMLAHLQQTEGQSARIAVRDWPADVISRLTKPPSRLWVAELPWSEAPAELLAQVESDTGDVREAVNHDMALLGLSLKEGRAISLREIRERFLVSRAWRWLEALVLGAPERELYFGELSALLHDRLLDDPRPYRKEVKNLVSNLLQWAAALAGDRVTLDRPAHSQRLRVQP